MLRSRTLFITLAIALIAIFAIASGRGRKSGIPSSSRPNDPWVFRSVLDKQPRMITFALNDHLWAAYSTDSCALYKAWDGGVDFEGAVYNMRHGPQPMSVGNAWFENRHKRPWSVTRNGQTETPGTDYKGHRYLRDGHAELMFDLVLSDGKRIRVNERPDFMMEDRQRGFERVFNLENVPDGAQVSLRANVSGIASASSIETDGSWKTLETKAMAGLPDNLYTYDVDGELTLNTNKPTRFAAIFVNQALVPNPFRTIEDEAATATVSPGERLMAKNDCRTCHNPKVKTVGPGYVDIAERYKNNPENVDKLVKKVIAGGAGNWGIAAMSPHPDLQPEDAKAMVSYVLSLDEGEDDGEGGAGGSINGRSVRSLSEVPATKWRPADTRVGDKDLVPGLLVRAFQLPTQPTSLTTLNLNAKPTSMAVATLLTLGAGDFGPYKENFAISAEGYLYLEKDDNVVMQLASDDGSRLYLDGQLLIDNDGPHGMDAKEAEQFLRAGHHAIRLEYFQGGGGYGISLRWARFGDNEFKELPAANLAHRRSDDNGQLAAMASVKNAIPGDGAPLKEVHPAYTLNQARPDEFLCKVAGMDFLPDGRLVVSTWDAMGGVYILDNVESGDPKKIKVKLIAKGLAEPLGLKVVDGEIYVLQKQELTKLVDTDGDDYIDEYQCFAKGWRASANFHEFAFGLVYKKDEDAFYASLAIAIMPGGASARPQGPDRGKVVKISRKDGSIEFVARGLRTPDGVGMGPNGEVLIADNQGDWLPSSKILLVKPGAFYNSFAVDSAAVAQLSIQQPIVWLPQDEIGNSPTQPTFFPDGPYKGQLVFGDVCYGGLQRVFMENVKDDVQGCVFRFTQGLEAGTHRLVWGPDGALYIGGIGNPGNWGQEGKLWYGLQKLKFNGGSTFDMLAIRAKTNGMEIEFTEPLPEGQGWDASNYLVKQWWYKPTNQYGGPKMDEETLEPLSVSVSPDRMRVFLEIPGLKPQHVVYIRLRGLPLSDLDHEIWSTEAWYTLNNIPDNAPGERRERASVFASPGDNELSEKEKREGWALLFDGKAINGWHNYGKQTIGAAWIIEDNSIHLDAKPKVEGEWQQREGGDILTAEEYQDFELQLDWKIAPCGNSGIIYNVVEDPARYKYGWMTGPEMQVLDNACHPDARIPKHRAGDLYDLISCKYETVKPGGEWNHARLVSKNGHVEHWLNNRMVVSYNLTSPEWPKMIAKSKFHEWKDFGLARKGRLMLQDHGDPVWYKNIKIKRL